MAKIKAGGTDAAGLSDEVIVELNGRRVVAMPEGVKGPDAAVWGAEQTKLPTPTSGLGIDPNVKGPDPVVWDNNRAAAVPAQRTRKAPAKKAAKRARRPKG